MFVQKSHGVELQKGVKRDSTIDIIKGLGIILMVMGHSGFPFTRVIYMFHMAIFFMASGYLWKDNHVRDWKGLKRFFWRRIKALWLPYIVANGIFVLLNNFFIIIGLYSVAPSSAAALQGASPQVWFDMGTTLKELLKTLLFLGGSQMGGAFWFLRTLFAISVGHALVVYISVTFRKSMKYLPLLAVALTAIVCEVLSFANLSIPTIVRACFSGYLAFWLGIIIREKGLVKYLPKRRWGVTLICAMALLIALQCLGKINMDRGEITSVGFFALASMTGWALCWIIASHVSDVFKSAFQYLGRHTLWIVILHFLSFKVVTWLYLWVSGEDMQLLATFPGLRGIPLLWIAYTVAGVVIPLAVEFAVKRSIGVFKQKVDK